MKKKIGMVYLPRDPTYYLGELDLNDDGLTLKNFLHVVIIFDPRGGDTQTSLFADPFFQDRKFSSGDVQFRELSQDNLQDSDYIKRYETVQVQLQAMRSGIAIPKGSNSFKPELVT